MAKKPLPDVEILRQLLEYDGETGALKWLPRPLEMFETANGRTAENCCSVWNAKYAGKPAGSRRKYVVVKFLGGAFLAHRLIWKLVTGEEPEEIDHIDRDKFNNRFGNLRDVSHSINMRNKPARTATSSGHKYIHWASHLNQWVIQASVPGKGQRQLAYAKTIEEAVIKRNDLLPALGYDVALDLQ